MHGTGFETGQYAWESSRPSQERKQRHGAENSSGIPGGGFSMRSRFMKIMEMAEVLALGFLLHSCGAQPFCPTCGTTVNGAYGVLNVIPVPEHNPTGEPGGPFNSFDISWFDPIQQKVYTADRIGLDVVATDPKNNFAVDTIGGLNQVANAGNKGSPCLGPHLYPAHVQGIPSILTRLGSVKFTR